MSLRGPVGAQHIAEVLARLRQVESHTRTLPSRFGGSSPTVFRRVDVVSGQTLTTGQLGVRYDDTVTAAPTAYDPTVTSTFIAGIGRGTLFIDGVNKGLVLLLNDGVAGFTDCLVATDRVFVSEAFALPVTAGGTVNVYRPMFM